MNTEQASRKLLDRSTLKWILLIIVVGLVIRLLALPFAMTSEPDAVSRTWIAWDWLSAPKLITSGVWGPLHTYIIALPMAIAHDPVFAPILFHILFSVITAVPLYLFTRNEFNNSRAGLFVAAIYMFYPIAIRNSLMATTEPPFGFFLALSLYFLSVARREGGNWKHAVGAGLSLMLAGMLRYEAWMLVPLMGISLYRKPRLMVPFVLASLPFPIFWMLGNLAQYGDPLYSMHWASNWELVRNLSGQQMTTGELLKRIGFYPIALILGLTPLVGLLAVAGVLLALFKRRPTIVWILPLVAVLALYEVTAAQGSLTLKGRYTITLAMFLLPFVAEVDNYLRLRIAAAQDANNRIAESLSTEPNPAPIARTSLPRRGASLAALAIIVTMLPLSYIGNIGPHVVSELYETSINAVPRLQDAAAVTPFSDAINANINRGTDGVISDFYRWEPTTYVALMTRLPPSQMFVAPGETVADIDMAQLSAFIEKYPTGLIILEDGSRFAQAIHFTDNGTATINGKTLTLSRLDAVSGEQPTVAVYRYHVTTTS